MKYTRNVGSMCSLAKEASIKGILGSVIEYLAKIRGQNGKQIWTSMIKILISFHKTNLINELFVIKTIKLKVFIIRKCKEVNDYKISLAEFFNPMLV